MPKPPAASSEAKPWTAERHAAQRVQRLLLVQRPAAQDAAQDVEDGGAGGLVLDVVGRRRGDRPGGVAARMRQDVGAVGLRGRLEAVGAGAADRRLAQRRGQLVEAEQRDAAQEAVATGDVVVERRRLDAQRRGDAGERHRVQALGVGDLRRRRDDDVVVEPRAGHAAQPTRAIAASIAAAGASTSLPWPGASRAGSSARRVRALSQVELRAPGAHPDQREARVGLGAAGDAAEASSRRRRSRACGRASPAARCARACGPASRRPRARRCDRRGRPCASAPSWRPGSCR